MKFAEASQKELKVIGGDWDEFSAQYVEASQKELKVDVSSRFSLSFFLLKHPRRN